MSDRWTPGIGDPTAIGWITVLIYLLAAAGCASAARHERGHAKNISGAVPFWVSMSLLMLALGINKQLDVQSLFTQVLRDTAKAQGWYTQRRPLQAAFILAVAAIGMAMLLVVPRRALTLHRSKKVALCGLTFVYTYILIRAASFHHVDLATHTAIFGVKLNWVFEIGGILVVIAGSLLARRQSPSRDLHPG